MDIHEWQNQFVEAISKRFPKEFTSEQRLLAIHRQLADVSEKIQFGGDVKHRIVAVLPDFFMLCHHYGIDLNQELPAILAWFNSQRGFSKK